MTEQMLETQIINVKFGEASSVSYPYILIEAQTICDLGVDTLGGGL